MSLINTRIQNLRAKSNMDKNELQNLANTLGIKPEELGKL